MQVPALSDTIVAVSSAWRASPLGIVRLSGPDSLALLAHLGAAPPPQSPPPPYHFPARVQVEPGLSLPADIFYFRAPRSYTGQDVVEIHAAGSLPLLRVLCAELIAAGARRALPGEFTARAYLNGRLSEAGVESVFSRIHAEDQASARAGQRRRDARTRQRVARCTERLEQLLAAIEAGIDFAEEEDVRFTTPAEVRATIDELLAELRELEGLAGAAGRAGRPHVALVGLPNAGKSTLFNALVGFERAIVSPIVGTTRDVLSAEIRLRGMDVVLQDSAGLGAAEQELELAAYHATEKAAGQADLVLWVHDSSAGWDERERRVLAGLDAERRLLVLTKADAAPDAPEPEGLRFCGCVRVSALRGSGLEELKRELERALRSSQAAAGLSEPDDLRAAAAALASARALADGEGADLERAELVAFELRAAHARIAGYEGGRLAEAVLSRIFSRFCIGK